MPLLKCTCGENTIVRTRRVIADKVLEDLGPQLRDFWSDLQTPEVKARQLPNGEAYDIWRFVVRTLQDQCKDAIAVCPGCDRVWLYPDGQDDGIAHSRDA